MATLIFVADEKLQWARQKLHIADFEFDQETAASITAYETAIKRLLNQYVVLPTYQRSLCCKNLPFRNDGRLAQVMYFVGEWKKL